MPVALGQTARRSRVVSARDIELFTELTGDRNPLHLRTTISNQDGVTVLDGTALVWTEPL